MAARKHPIWVASQSRRGSYQCRAVPDQLGDRTIVGRPKAHRPGAWATAHRPAGPVPPLGRRQAAVRAGRVNEGPPRQVLDEATRSHFTLPYAVIVLTEPSAAEAACAGPHQSPPQAATRNCRSCRLPVWPSSELHRPASAVPGRPDRANQPAHRDARLRCSDLVYRLRLVSPSRRGLNSASVKKGRNHGHDWQDPADAQPGQEVVAPDSPYDGAVAQYDRQMAARAA